ncbi:SWIM zinc finger family protein [Anaerorhabdus furcosa]|uniref:SWIM zinc finger n=1 Tax=Anaerorhabdus furcosa TaxID=118967 RepID=A0A1T4NPB0_9FIRM|nr:SWIM zinc finger family protein [Anaerorhabdus furcosa]SJZ81022.1 SWIM zinc finger [Anaerorhabdus furcosa]
MKKINLDQYFESRILKRGYNYYREGSVFNVKKIGDVYTAYVQGNSSYRVRVDLNKEPYDMECSCPYAEVDYCKHMAALLYYVKNNEEDISQGDKNDLKKQVKILLAGGEAQKIFAVVEHQVNRLCGRDGMITWNKGEYFVDIIFNATKQAELLLMEEDIFVLITKLYHLIATISMDGSNGEHGWSFTIVNKLTLKYISICKENFIKFENYIVEELEQHLLGDFSIEPIHTLDDYVKDRTTALLAIQCIERIENLIPKLEDFISYGFEEFIVKKVTWYYSYGNKGTAIKVANKHLKNDEMLTVLKEIYKQENNINGLLNIMEKKIDRCVWTVLEDNVNELIQLYVETGNEDRISCMLEKAIYREFSSELFLKLKKYYPKDDWNEYIVNLSNKLKKRSIYNYMVICKHERWFDNLMNEVEQHQDIRVLEQYAETLRENYHEKITQLYRYLILSIASYQHTRKGYVEVVDHLSCMSKFDVNESCILYEELLEKFKNRPAFIDELTYFKNIYL